MRVGFTLVAMTYLIVAIYVDGPGDIDAVLARAARAAAEGADLVEYRIDTLADDPDDPAGADAVAKLVKESPLPCILTCRAASEAGPSGGGFDGPDQQRIALLEHAGMQPRRPAYLDLELATYQRSANLRQKVGLVVDHPRQTRPDSAGLILSSHDFDGRPADLLQRVAAMAEFEACRVVKIVWTARSIRDNLEAFELLQARVKPTIALCMGRFGLLSRVLAKKFGAFGTYAALEAGEGTAPGQPTLAELKGLYRWDAIRPETRVYGVIGWPVEHSMSPAVHNAGFAHVEAHGGTPWASGGGIYLPMPVAPSWEAFKATVLTFLDTPGLHFRGASVTIPHKEHLLRLVETQGGEIEPLAKRIRAANTLTVRDDGSLHASNTDYAAARDAVLAAMPEAADVNPPAGIEATLQGRRVAVLGAGGAARAVVAAFAEAGAHVTIHNRTPERAAGLAREFADLPGSITVAPDGQTSADIWINCTPVGMHPHVDATPLPDPPETWGPGTVVFDTIYNPERTRLLRDAAERGCVTIPGTEMFVRQAAVQFELWTGQPAPLEVFREAMRLGLAGFRRS